MKLGNFNLNEIYKGDALKLLKEIPDNSIDTIITDPPYGLEFMGKEWDSFKVKGQGDGWQVAGKPSMEKFNGRNDWHSKPKPVFRGHTREHWVNYQQWTTKWAKEVFRVAKPGATLLSFGGTRTFHRMACGIEDAGWIIKDTLMWLYGSGFPKATDISKQIDKKFGAEREIIGKREKTESYRYKGNNVYQIDGDKDKIEINITAPTTLEAKLWNGYKSHGLKPAYEPIIMAMKPNEGSYADNALKWGVAGLNIDAGRIPFRNKADEKESKGKNQHSRYKNSIMRNPAPHGIYHQDKRPAIDYTADGRFPTNILLDEESAKILDEQSGISKSTGGRIGKKDKSNIDFGLSGKYRKGDLGFGDKGGASRFFYVAKASRKERNMGLKERANTHPTVKPIKLIEYLVKLTSMPNPNQVYLDPFIGSGTTAIACIKQRKNWIGFEKEPEYCEIAKKRIEYELKQKRL